MKKLFRCTIWYFKPSGKFGYSHSGDFQAEDCGPEGHPTCAMDDVVQKIKDLRAIQCLPGLASGTWDTGYIVVNCEQYGYPILIDNQNDMVAEYLESSSRKDRL